MSAARRSDGLLSAEQTLALLSIIARSARGDSADRFLRDLTASYPAAWSKGRNTLSLLGEMNIVSSEEGNIQLSADATNQNKWREIISRNVAELLVELLSRNSRPQCLQRKRSGGLWIDSMLLPKSAEGFPLWVLEFGIASRDEIESRFWQIREKFEKIFLGAAREANNEHLRRVMSSSELEDRLKKNAEHGREAEEWVLDFERKRLASHPLLEQVKRISDNDVGFGCDILSFSGVSSLRYDLYIEVKSFVGLRRFFWSRNEIDFAREKGENYSLYLVDRSLMHSPNYEPQIIPGPHSALILSADSGWTNSPVSFEFVETSRPSMPDDQL